MKLRDRMIYAGLVSSSLKARHPANVREFYRDLLHACDDHGRFEADVKLLRGAIYAPILDRVSERDVEGYLLRLADAKHDDIKLYTVKGRRFGKVTKWRQTRLKNLVAEYPPEDGDPELPLIVCDPPPKPARPKKERKKEVCGPREAGNTHDTRLAELCLPELQTRWPKHDVAACLREAVRYVREKRGGQSAVTVSWFEAHWLPGAGERKDRPVEPRPDLPTLKPAEVQAAMEAQRQQFAAMAEPPPGTLDHALWMEARSA